ncbi:hypothetical protein niasHT_016594 [Heterodera trifolii]|uniref:Uncharacterized protein n=1 Tax=Heterodera trifolii TaxID=157864 RepID=A0ABD2L8U2_9BILA
MHDSSTSHSDSNIDISVGSAKNRTEQGDESGEFGEEDVLRWPITQHTCLPVKAFEEGPHTAEQMALGFRCNCCRQIFAQLRACNAHQKKSAQCQGTQPVQEERHQPQHANVVRQVRLRAPRLQEPVSPAQPADAGLPAVRDHGQTAFSAGANRMYRLIVRPRLHWLHNGIRQALPRPAQPYRRPEQIPTAHLIVNAQPEPLDNQTAHRRTVGRVHQRRPATGASVVHTTSRSTTTKAKNATEPNGRRCNQINADDGPPLILLQPHAFKSCTALHAREHIGRSPSRRHHYANSRLKCFMSCQSGSSGAAAPHPDLTTSATGVEKVRPKLPRAHYHFQCRQTTTAHYNDLAPLKDSAHPQKGALEEFWQTDWRCGQLPSTESARPKKADARRERNESAIAWLDQTNAFGSIPHEVIFRSLKWSGLDNTTVNTIRLLYNNNAT